MCREAKKPRECSRRECCATKNTYIVSTRTRTHVYIYIYIERERAQLFPFSRERFVVVLILVKKKKTSQVKKSPLQKNPQKILRNTFVDKQMSVHIGAMGQDRPPAPMKLKSAEFYELVRAIGTFRSKIKRILFSQILCRFSVTNGISLKMFPFFSLERENISARTRCGFCSLRI
jgi:hypothetical protein